MFGNQSGLLYGPSGSARKPAQGRNQNPNQNSSSSLLRWQHKSNPAPNNRPISLLRGQQTQQRSRPLVAQSAGTGIFSRGESGGNGYGARQGGSLAPRLLGAAGKRGVCTVEREVVVISDSDDDEEGDGEGDTEEEEDGNKNDASSPTEVDGNESVNTDDLFINQPLNDDKFQKNSGAKRRSPGVLEDEGYGSFERLLGELGDRGDDDGGGGYARKRARPMKDDEDEDDRNGRITIPEGLGEERMEIGGSPVDRDDRAEAVERSRRLREAARAAKEKTGSSPPGSLATKIDRNGVFGSQPLHGSRTFPARPEQKTQLKSTHDEDDIEKAWVQEQLARAEAEKPRTGFFSGIRPPEPVRTRNPWAKTTNRVPLQIGGSSLMVPFKTSRETKEHEKDVERITSTGEALARFRAKDPANEKTRLEEREYERLKEKVDNGDILASVERNRLGYIKKNVKRREYRLGQTELGMPKAPATTSQRGRPRKQAGANNQPSSQGALGLGDGKIEHIIQTTQPFDNSMEASNSLHKPDNRSPSKQRDLDLELFGDRFSEERDELSLPKNPYDNRITTTRRKTVAGKGLIKDILAAETETNQPPPTPDLTSSFSEEEEEEEDGESSDDDEDPEPVWQYDVYRRQIDPLNDDTKPVFIGTYFKPRRAEEAVVREIKGIHASATLEELSGFELGCEFEENRVRKQVLTFTGSGRSFEVYIERDVVPDGPVKERKKMTKLPTKHYIVIEEVTEVTEVEDGGEGGDELFGDKMERWLVTRRTVNKESYVLRAEANEKANRLFVAHQIAHLDQKDKFDMEKTGKIDTEGQSELYRLEYGERLFDKSEVVTGKDGKKSKVHIWVQGQLMRGPRN